jgi:hypothetical protein
MTLLDGKFAKQTLLERIVDPLMNSRRLVIVAAATFAISVLATPVVIYFAFAYFTAKEGPWWLEHDECLVSVYTSKRLCSFATSPRKTYGKPA